MALALALFGVATNALATPAALFGAGAASQAMGGTGVSFVSDDSAAYINPAGLSNAAKAFAFGVQAARFALTESPASTDSLNDESHALLFGVTVPLPFPDPVSDRLVLGLHVSSPGAAIARVAILNESRAQFPLLAPRADALNFNLALGAKLPWGLHVGVGSGLLASLDGKVAIDSGGDAARSVTDDELVLTAAPVIGIEYAPNDTWAFGLVWRSALQSTFDLNVTVENLGSLIVPPLHVTGLAGFDPSELNLEASHVLGAWRLALGVGHRAWSALHTLRDATVQCPPEARPCAALTEHELHLRDTWVPRLGVEHVQAFSAKTQLALRAGYFFEPTPVPAQRGTARVFDNARHALTAGYGVRFAAPVNLELQMSAQWHHLLPRDHALTEGARTVTTSSRGEIVGVCWTLGGEF